MTIAFILVLLILLIFYTISFAKKKNILLSFTGDEHQKKTVDISVPLIGGFILLILFSIIFFELNHQFFLILLILIFMIGISSDLKIISSPTFRILLQSIVIFIAVYFLDMSILTTRINFLDFALSNYYINIFFTIFCILIVVNGANLIDGLNGLVLGYFFIVFFFFI
jgi:UDP-N-acetylmuramyl pentapeptide phosphotransferase/UDP-N-acetylglucosamine-1-phosphate transferase